MTAAVYTKLSPLALVQLVKVQPPMLLVKVRPLVHLVKVRQLQLNPNLLKVAAKKPWIVMMLIFVQLMPV